MSLNAGSSGHVVKVDAESSCKTAPTDSINDSTTFEKKSPSLDSILMQSLNESDMIVCVKDINKIVLKQNDACKTLCKDREGEECCIGCMEIYEVDTSQQWEKWGNRTYKNCYLHDDYYNVSLLCSESYLTTILQPLDKQHAKAIEYYKNIGLSKRELEVISLVVTGSSNIDICDELNISNATLRSHLNKVYSKVNEAGGSLEYLPKKRSNAVST